LLGGQHVLGNSAAETEWRVRNVATQRAPRLVAAAVLFWFGAIAGVSSTLPLLHSFLGCPTMIIPRFTHSLSWGRASAGCVFNWMTGMLSTS
jgi:hypothetical protein